MVFARRNRSRVGVQPTVTLHSGASVAEGSPDEVARAHVRFRYRIRTPEPGQMEASRCAAEETGKSRARVLNAAPECNSVPMREDFPRKLDGGMPPFDVFKRPSAARSPSRPVGPRRPLPGQSAADPAPDPSCGAPTGMH